MKTEEQAIIELQAILNGEFDHSLELIGQKLDESIAIFEKLNLLQAHEEDPHSILSQAIDYLTGLMVKDYDPLTEVPNERELKEWLDSKPNENELKKKFWDLVNSNHFIQAKAVAKALEGYYLPGGYEYTPLHSACEDANIDAVKVLVEAGFDKNQYFELIDHCSDQRGTPLTLAISVGSEEIVEYLLSFDDLNVTTEGYSHTTDTPYWIQGDRTIPFNALCNSQFINRVVELGGSPNDCDEDYSLLWAVLENNDVEFFKRLIEWGVDTDIEGEYGPFLHQVLTKYLDHPDSRLIEIMSTTLKYGFDLTTQCNDGFTFIQRVLNSGNSALLELIGLDADVMEEVAEFYEKPLPNLPYELLDVGVDEADIRRNVIPALLDGFYGWEEDKLIRFMNLAVSVIGECFGEDIPYDDEIEIVWDELNEIPCRYLLKTKFQSVQQFESEFYRFVESLKKKGELENPNKSLITKLDRIRERLKDMLEKNCENVESDMSAYSR